MSAPAQRPRCATSPQQRGTSDVLPGGVGERDSTSRRSLTILDVMQQLDLTDNERAALIIALRRLVDPQPLSPQNQALKAILDRLDPHKPQSLPEDASTG